MTDMIEMKLIEKCAKYQTFIQRIKFSFIGTPGQNVITRTYATLFLIEEIPHLLAKNLAWVSICALKLAYSKVKEGTVM